VADQHAKFIQKSGFPENHLMVSSIGPTGSQKDPDGFGRI
jgi:hypothetical protein